MFKHLSAILTILVLVTGCATAPPVVLNQQSFAAKSSIKPEKVLLIYDISLKKAHMEPALLFTVDEQIENQFGPIGKIMVGKITAQGIQAEFEIHSEISPIIFPDFGYSHILLERLVSAKMTTRNGSASGTFGDYTWVATLYEVNKGSNIAIYKQTYVSDAINCFSDFIVETGKESCRNSYIDLVLNQLSPIGIKSQ